MRIPDYTFDPSLGLGHTTQQLNEFVKAVSDAFRRISGDRVGTGNAVRQVTGGSALTVSAGEIVMWSNGVASTTSLNSPAEAPGALVFVVPEGSVATLYVSDGISWKGFTGV